MTGGSIRLEADNSRLQRANDQVLKVGRIKTLDITKMEDEIVFEGIYNILYQERLVYAYFSLEKRVGLRTFFNLAVSQDHRVPGWETTAVFCRVSSDNFR